MYSTVILGRELKVRRKTRTVRSKRKQDWKSVSIAKVTNVVKIVGPIGLILVLLFSVYVYYSEIEHEESQIDSSLRKADSLYDAGAFEEAIDEYEGILKIVSSKKLPDEYAKTQNRLGVAYAKLAMVRDKEINLGKAINAYLEALKFYTEKNYPIKYQAVKSNLEQAQSQLQ